MKINKNYKIGLRAVKTAIAVSLCMLMTYIFKIDEAFIAAFAAIICMQPTYNQTFKSGLNRMFGTVLGGVIGYALLELATFIPLYQSWWNVILAPVCLLIVIYLCNMFNKQPSVSIACIVLLCCIAQPAETINAMLFNKFLWPKRSKQEYDKAINNLVENSKKDEDSNSSKDEMEAQEK